MGTVSLAVISVKTTLGPIYNVRMLLGPTIESMYHFAYHVASHVIALYFILLVYHCVCEYNSVGL